MSQESQPRFRFMKKLDSGDYLFNGLKGSDNSSGFEDHLRCVAHTYEALHDPISYRDHPSLIYILYILSNLHASEVPQTKAIVSIENVVASASINQRVDLNQITKNFVDVEYHPDIFPGLVFRLKVPKTATLVFSSGKMVCTGAKSEEQSRKAVAEVVRRLRKGGIPIKNEAEVVIQNMVASANLGGRIRLEEAARVLPKSMYEPEQFPGLIHRMPDPKTVILLFSSGKLVCTGAKREGDVYRAVNNLHVMLEEKGLMIY